MQLFKALANELCVIILYEANTKLLYGV